MYILNNRQVSRSYLRGWLKVSEGETGSAALLARLDAGERLCIAGYTLARL